MNTAKALCVSLKMMEGGRGIGQTTQLNEPPRETPPPPRGPELLYPGSDRSSATPSDHLRSDSTPKEYGYGYSQGGGYSAYGR